MINICQFYQGSTTTSTNFTTLTLSQVFFKQFCSIFLLALLENVHIIHCKTLCTNSNIPKQTDGKFWDALETTTRHKERKWPMWARTILKNSMKCTLKTKSVLKNSPAHLFINFFEASRENHFALLLWHLGCHPPLPESRVHGFQHTENGLKHERIFFKRNLMTYFFSCPLIIFFVCLFLHLQDLNCDLCI